MKLWGACTAALTCVEVLLEGPEVPGVLARVHGGHHEEEQTGADGGHEHSGLPVPNERFRRREGLRRGHAVVERLGGLHPLLARVLHHDEVLHEADGGGGRPRRGRRRRGRRRGGGGARCRAVRAAVQVLVVRHRVVVAARSKVREVVVVENFALQTREAGLTEKRRQREGSSWA